MLTSVLPIARSILPVVYGDVLGAPPTYSGTICVRQHAPPFVDCALVWEFSTFPHYIFRKIHRIAWYSYFDNVE